MASQWGCPCQDCEPTDFAPAVVESFEDDGVKQAVCAGSCGLTHPVASFKPVQRG